MDKNAQQCNLTGMVVIAPSFSVVVVEGNSRGLRHYKKLMMRRIDWSGARKPGSSRNNDDENGGGDNGADDNDTFAALDDLCIMVWEGQVKERMFKGFRFYRNCTDERGVELFSRSNCLHYWNSAKTYISQFS